VEAAVIIPSKSPFNLRISDDRFLPGLTELVQAIREASKDVRIGVQIMQHLKLSKSGWRQKVEDFKPEELSAIVDDHVPARNGSWPRDSNLSRFTWPMPTAYRLSCRGRTKEVMVTAEGSRIA